MSSPKASAAIRSKPAAAQTTKSTGHAHEADTPSSDVLSSDTVRIAAQVEQALAEGNIDALTPQALHALMAAGCKLYAAQIEAGRDVLPLSARTSVTATEVMTAASGLLRAVNLAVFELGMWQSWTGR